MLVTQARKAFLPSVFVEFFSFLKLAVIISGKINGFAAESHLQLQHAGLEFPVRENLAEVDDVHVVERFHAQVGQPKLPSRHDSWEHRTTNKEPDQPDCRTS